MHANRNKAALRRLEKGMMRANRTRNAFAVLAILGIVVDPTTQGVGDSEQALTYTVPKKDAEKEESSNG